MNPAEASAHADGIAMYLKNNFPPAEAMYVLSKLVAKMLFAATPNAPGAIDKSIELLMTSIGEEMQREGGHGGLLQ